MTPELIGRREELAAVEQFLDAVSSWPAGLFLEGEAGIGKTRIWQRALEGARARSIRVLATRPGGAEVRLSFNGLSDLLDGALAEVLPRLAAPQRRALSVALLLEDARGAPPDRRAVSAAFLGALRVLAAESPLVVAIDDLQWLDSASASAVAFATRRLELEPVGLLATLRVAPGEPEPAELADALGHTRLARMPVGPLSVSAIYELIKTRLDLELRRPLLLRVHEAAAGNPFLALELARALRDAEHDVEPDEPLPVPHGTRDLVRARLARLTDGAQETLLTVAALSQPTLELLDRAIPESAAEDIRAAVDAGVVELEGGRVRFTHPLLASIHYESASPSKRREAHSRLAEVSADREERARHVALASDGPNENVATALDGAVAAAEARGAIATAAELAAKAVLLTPRGGKARLHGRRLRAARLAFAAGDRLAAERTLEEALAAARSSTERAEALLELGMVHSFEELTSGLAFLRAAADVAVTDPRLRASILLRLAPREGYSGAGYERAHELAREAVALAETGEDEELLAKALSTVAYIEHARGLAVRHDLMRRAEAIEHRSGIAVDGPTAIYAEVLAFSGLHDAARERLQRIIAVGRETGDVGVCRALFRLAMTEWESGNWDRAAELGLEAEEIATQSGRETVAPLGAVVLALVEAMQGDVDAGRARALAALEASDRAGRHSGGPRGALALIELSLERYGEAYEFAAPAIERAQRAGSAFPGWQDSDAIDALTSLGRVDEARMLLAPFDEVAHRLGLPFLIAAAARCRGLIAATIGDLAGAEAELDEAVAVGDRADMPLELGRSFLVLGSVRRRRNEKRAARVALERALELFEQLGATVWAERARQELGRIGGRDAPHTELSATEAQIVDLVVAGRSNKEVAHSLHLSPKTVEWNLSKVYRKLGVQSRTELAAKQAPRR